MKKKVMMALTGLFALAFLISAGFLVDYYAKSRKQKNAYDELSSLVEQNQQPVQDVTPTGDANDNQGDNTVTPEPSKFVEITNPDTGKTVSVLREYAPIYEKNMDTVGWIKVEGTDVNYPVMQTPEWVNFYLTRNFEKEKSKYGAIYANEMADLNAPSDNITLYGHKMKDGSMFASLHEYKSKKFFEKYPFVKFDTLTEKHNYVVAAVFMTTANESGFQYHNFVNGTEEEFNAFVATCKSMSLYDTGVEMTYGDKLLTLSTCEHTIDNGRFVVVAKRIS